MSSKILTLAGLFISLGYTAGASADVVSHFQGFENNTGPWSLPDQVIRVKSNTSAPYASGIDAESGNFFGRILVGPESSANCGETTVPQNVGPFSKLGCYGTVFPEGGYTVRASVYLDTKYAAFNADKRFDLSHAVNDPQGNGRRDFVFNAGTCSPLSSFSCGSTGLPGFAIGTSNNAGRCGPAPSDPSRNPVFVTKSGWYTFEYVMGNVNGVLVATLNLYTPSEYLLGTWTLSQPDDLIGSTVGGNRYLWMANQEIPSLAVDNIERSGGQICGTLNCKYKSHGKTEGESCIAQAYLPAPVAAPSPGPSPSPAPEATLAISCSNGATLFDETATVRSLERATLIGGRQGALAAILGIGRFSEKYGQYQSVLKARFLSFDNEIGGACVLEALPEPEDN